MSKQTSVEWFATQLYEKFEMKGDGSIIDNLLEQAKEMHKQEIIDAYDEGELSVVKNAEQYYQETFVSKGSGMSEKPNNHIESQLPQQETLYTEEQAIEFAKWLAANWFPMWVKDKFVWEHDWDKNCEEQKYKGYYNEKELFNLFLSLKQPKKD